jgi:aquaporin Z
MVLIYGLGETSGAHFNPAVTVSLAAARRFEWQAVPGYVAVQCGGALAASGLLRWLFPTVVNLGATRPSGSDSQSLVFEAVLTFFLMLVILQVSIGAKEKGITAAVAIGATVGLEAMFAGPICGASMNPARSRLAVDLLSRPGIRGALGGSGAPRPSRNPCGFKLRSVLSRLR